MFIKYFSQINSNKKIQQISSISNGNNKTLPLKILTYFKLLCQNCANFLQKFLKMWKKPTNIHKRLNLDNSL